MKPWYNFHLIPPFKKKNKNEKKRYKTKTEEIFDANNISSKEQAPYLLVVSLNKV